MLTRLAMFMKIIRLVPIVFSLSAVLACGGTSKSEPSNSSLSGSTTLPEGLGDPCDVDAGRCAAGQECVTAASSEGPTSTCEIRCKDDSNCPSGLRCNTQPVPDSIPNVCIE